MTATYLEWFLSKTVNEVYDDADTQTKSATTAAATTTTVSTVLNSAATQLSQTYIELLAHTFFTVSGGQALKVQRCCRIER
jgi:hypothetical protein